MRPLLIIDAANVIGSVPDGWWRDRKGAAERLRDRLAVQLTAETDILMVVEGKAKGIQSIPRVPVHDAPGSGDDAIVDLVRAHHDRDITVVTSDRGLRERVTSLGAKVCGPSSIRPTG